MTQIAADEKSMLICGHLRHLRITLSYQTNPGKTATTPSGAKCAESIPDNTQHASIPAALAPAISVRSESPTASVLSFEVPSSFNVGP